MLGNCVNSVVIRLEFIHTNLFGSIAMKCMNLLRFTAIVNAHATPQGRYKMERKTKSRSLFGAFAIDLVLLCIVTAFCLFAFVRVTSSVSGTASLPNGTTATINGPFSCSVNTATTEIEAGGHVFAFSPKNVSIDGVTVGPLDATVTDVQIDASFWSASLHINGMEVSKLR